MKLSQTDYDGGYMVKINKGDIVKLRTDPMESPLGKAYLTDENGKTIEVTSQDRKKEIVILTKEKYDELLTKVAHLEDRIAWLTMKMENKG